MREATRRPSRREHWQAAHDHETVTRYLEGILLEAADCLIVGSTRNLDALTHRLGSVCERDRNAVESYDGPTPKRIMEVPPHPRQTRCLLALERFEMVVGNHYPGLQNWLGRTSKRRRWPYPDEDDEDYEVWRREPAERTVVLGDLAYEARWLTEFAQEIDSAPTDGVASRFKS